MATLIQKLQLLRGLIDGEIAHTAPFYVQVNPTNVCNMDCYGCRYHSSKMSDVSPTIGDTNYMPLGLVERLCEELPRMGTREAIICGEGESLLHPHWHELVSSLKRAGLSVQLLTNGTLLDQSTAALLLDSGLDLLYVSFWATSEEEYVKCYPGSDPDNFRRSLEGIRLVTRLKSERQASSPTVILAGPLNKYNYRSIDQRIALAHDAGCDGVRFSPFNDHSGEFAAASVPDEDMGALCGDLAASEGVLKSLSLTHNLDQALLRYRLGRNLWQHVPCYAGWFYSHISFDGRVKPCGSCTTPLGNLNENTFEQIWNGPEYRAFRVKGLTTRGVASLRQQCDCDWCCQALDSYAVHRYFRWIAPLVRRRP
ncbi:MAG TPA: radical SAM protein [Chloroflexi bacterium]|nr:radical SAM protein [Chloroflexota bacterium]